MWTKTCFLIIAFVHGAFAFKGLKMRTVENEEMDFCIELQFDYPIKEAHIKGVLHPFQKGMKPILIVLDNECYESLVGNSTALGGRFWFTEKAYQFYNFLKKRLDRDHNIKDVVLVGAYGLKPSDYEDSIQTLAYPNFEEVIEIFGYGKFTEIPKKKMKSLSEVMNRMRYKAYEDADLKALLDRYIDAQLDQIHHRRYGSITTITSLGTIGSTSSLASLKSIFSRKSRKFSRSHK